MKCNVLVKLVGREREQIRTFRNSWIKTMFSQSWRLTFRMVLGNIVEQIGFVISNAEIRREQKKTTKNPRFESPENSHNMSMWWVQHIKHQSTGWSTSIVVPNTRIARFRLGGLGVALQNLFVVRDMSGFPFGLWPVWLGMRIELDDWMDGMPLITINEYQTILNN